MSEELETFNTFVDDLIYTDENLLKGELDLLLFQYLFNSLDLDKFEGINESIDEYIAA